MSASVRFSVSGRIIYITIKLREETVQIKIQLSLLLVKINRNFNLPNKTDDAIKEYGTRQRKPCLNFVISFGGDRCKNITTSNRNAR